MNIGPLFMTLLLAPAAALAQKPVINAGGVVNAAGLLPVSQPWSGLAPGSIAAVFGGNLASVTMPAPGFPLPLSLGGASVTVNGAKAPLFYVSPNQINFQVPSNAPWSYDAYGQISIVVTTAAGSSNAVVADVVGTNAMIFTQDGGGCGHPGAIVNVSADGKRSLNSRDNSVEPGEFIELYGTGLGAVYNPPPDGSPASSNPTSRTIETVGVSFEPQTGSIPTQSEFSGRAPGLVGVDQVNAMVPVGVREGCSVPVLIGLVPATISIRTGGGPCVDPPIQSAGSLLLQRSIVLNDSTVPETDSLLGSFSASPGKQVPPPLIQMLPDGIENLSQTLSPTCAIPGYSTPDAGVIAITGPGLPPAIGVPPATSNGVTSYNGMLPAGSISTGTYQISAEGGNGIGEFQVPVAVGPGIQITSQFPQGQVHQGISGFVVTWTGGEAGEAVTVTVVQHEVGFDHVCLQVVPATAGVVTFDYNNYNILGLLSSEIDVQVGPDPTQPQTFTAPGLTLGGQVSWAIVYRFVGLTF